MAAGGERQDNASADTQAVLPSTGPPPKPSQTSSLRSEDDEDEEEIEPRLKYTKLTAQLASIYRKDDSTSACLTSGDKLVLARPIS